MGNEDSSLHQMLGNATKTTAVTPQAKGLQTLARTYTQPLIRYFLRRGVPAEAAEDCAQEVFLRLAKMADPAIENPQAYLFTIAASVTVDRARKLKSNRASQHISFENLFLSDHTPGPARILEGRDGRVIGPLA